MKRNIIEVIHQIKNTIPHNEHYYSILDDIIDSALYRAPEIEYIDWGRLSMIVSDIVKISPTDEVDEIDEWKLETLKILMDKKTVEEVKDRLKQED